MILKQHVADKTDWRRMLKGAPEAVDLAARRDELVDASNAELQSLEKELSSNAFDFLDKESPVAIDFPVQQYPEKVKAHNFDKTEEITGVLNGIKGQYLILDTGVLNIRKFGGYLVEVEA